MVNRIQQLQQHIHINQPKKKITPTTVTFKDVFDQAQYIKISKHAKQRLKERDIQINDKQWQVVSEKMNEAKAKGVTDSLVILDQAALLVSTKNHTVVTAMDREEASAKIFTNINGTILINE